MFQTNGRIDAAVAAKNEKASNAHIKAKAKWEISSKKGRAPTAKRYGNFGGVGMCHNKNCFVLTDFDSSKQTFIVGDEPEDGVVRSFVPPQKKGTPAVAIAKRTRSADSAAASFASSLLSQ